MLSSEASALNKRIEAERRKAKTKDLLLTPPTEQELLASGTRGTDLGRVWDGVNKALASMDQSTRQQVRDEITSAVEQIMEKYIGGGGWSVSGNGTAFTGSPGEQGGSTTDALRHLSTDSQQGISRTRQMNAAAKRHWNRR